MLNDAGQTNKWAPQTVLQILDRAFRIYRDNLVTFVGLVLVVNVPLLLLSIPANIQYQTDILTSTAFSTTLVPSIPPSVVPVLVLSIITGLAQGVFVTGIISYITSEHHLGKQITIMEAFQAMQPRFVPLALGLILYGLLVGIAIFLIFSLTFLCGIGILGLGVLVYAMLAINYFLVPVIALENIDAQLGVRRAWSLGKARFWPALGLLIAISLLTFILTLGFSLVAGLFTSPLQDPTVLFSAGAIIDLLLNSLIGFVLAPIGPIALTLMYYDSRVRLEGLDIAVETFEDEIPHPSQLPSPNPTGPILDRQDAINIILLTVGTIVIALVISVAATGLVNVLLPGMSF